MSYEWEYGPKAQNLSLTLDGLANDGAADERDQTMGDVENIQGGDGNDLIVGDGLNNRFMGGYGADTIHGGDGRDVIADGVCSHGPSVRRDSHCLWRERPFSDELFGDGGDDTLMAYSGGDTLFGGAGDDRMELVGLDEPTVSRMLDGGIGSDEAVLKPGADSIVNVENLLDQHGRPVK